MDKNRLRGARYRGFLTAAMLAFAFLLTFNCSTAFAGWTFGDVPDPPKDPLGPPQFFYQKREICCYDIETYALLNCPFNLSIAEDTSLLPPPGISASLFSSPWAMKTSVNGGHTHSRMVGTGIGTLSGASVTQVSPLEVRGQTANTINVVYYDKPEMSGTVIRKMMFVPPPNYMCVPGYLAACTVIHLIDFEVGGLVPLPPPSTGGDYTFSGIPLASGATNYHTDNHYGTPKLVAAIQEVARNFKIRSQGRTLSVNDMSLPWGGLYDYHSTGFKPHTYHRKGESVDIDSKTVKVAGNINAKLLEKLTKEFKRQGCDKVEEEPIHYECK